MECNSDMDKEFLLHMKNMRNALLTLCDCFLVRAKDNDDDPLWKRFYSIQMTSYLVSKRNLDVSAPEGDMVHDLIRDTWQEVKESMKTSPFGPISNVDQWFKTIRIDFPIDPFDPKCTFFRQEIYYLKPSVGQNATKKDEAAEAVSN
ncbi:MAG: hypothetical protein J6W39_08620 [Spirochaetales bacterium]|nr:hypothetical protein [Spirochaetales bacterium]